MKKISLEELRSHRKHTLYTINWRILTRISPYLEYLFVNFTKFSANQITFIWGIVGIMGISLISLGGYFNMVLGILIFQFALLLDLIDGTIARASKKNNLAGLWMDSFWHYLHRALLLIALGVGVYQTTGEILYIFLGVTSGLLFTFDNLSKLKVYESLVHHQGEKYLQEVREHHAEVGNVEGLKKGSLNWLKTNFLELLRPNVPLSLMFWAIIFNFSKAYLFLMVLISLSLFIKGFIRAYNVIVNVPYLAVSKKEI